MLKGLAARIIFLYHCMIRSIFKVSHYSLALKMQFTLKNLLSFVVGPNFEIPPITELSKLMSVTHILKARMSVNQLFDTPDEEIHQWYLNFTFI